MKRDQSLQPRGRATLGEALSPKVKDDLHRLRESLERDAREAVSSQLAEAQPPWRRKRRTKPPLMPRNAEKTSGTVHQEQVKKRSEPTKPRIGIIPAETRAPRMPAAAPEPKEPAFKYWDFPNEEAVRELPPDNVSDADRSSFDELLRAGAASSPVVGEGLFVILGLDFGTSSTKMIVRLPYEAGEPTIAIPAPKPCRSYKDPYLWQTVLWLREGGTFYPWPETKATPLNTLKQGLIQGRSESEIPDLAGDIPTSRAQAGVAYLTFIIRYVKGWLLRNRPDLFRGRKPVWFVNLGLPTASYDDQKLADPYRRIGAAALQLSKTNRPVTVEATRSFLAEPHVTKAGASAEAAEYLGVSVIPEAAAQMTGFAKSTRGAPGLYLLVDVGAMTLDACMFRLRQKPATRDLYAFLAAQVRPLGVESFHWFLREGKTDEEFRQQCNRTLQGIVWHTKSRRARLADNWNPGNDVPVFLAGGGAANCIHREIVESLGPWLKKHTRNDGIRLLELPVPDSIELPSLLHDFGRMSVAWGLSYPPTEIGQIRPMSDIDDISPPPTVDISDRFISKDQV